MTVALIVVDTERGFFGHPARLGDPLGGTTVLTHTLARAASLKPVKQVLLVHPAGQDPMSLVDRSRVSKPMTTFAFNPAEAEPERDAFRRRASRKWAQTAWRGGIGQATALDELLPPGPLAAAMRAHHATSAYVVRGDWCLFDPALAEKQLAVHLEAPEARRLVFTQAPPGLAGVAISRGTLDDLSDAPQRVRAGAGVPAAQADGGPDWQRGERRRARRGA